MVIEDYYDEFLNNFGLPRSKNKASSSNKQYLDIKSKAQKYEAAVEKLEELQAENERLREQVNALKVNEGKIQELTEQVELYGHNLKRVKADYSNFRKIEERENAKYKKYMMEKILEKLIGHYQDLKRTLNMFNEKESGESTKKGLEIIIKNFEKILEEEGVKELNSKGEKFDPYKHEVLLVEVNDDLPENTIIEELEKGYLFKDKVLRPAKVKISKHNDKNNNTN